MKQIPQIIFISVCLAHVLSAQNPQPGLSDRRLDLLERELMLRGLEPGPSKVEKEIAERRYAQYLEQQFVAKMNRFVEVWKAFTAEYNTKSVFNVKLAAELAKAFHDLEKSEGWPKTRR